MRITIHRGIDQIGGCITEIATDNAKILIDLGQNLPDGEGVVNDGFANFNTIEKITNGVEDYDDPDDEKLYETDDPDDTGISKRYGKETFRKKGGFMHKLLEGMEDDLDDNLEDDLDDPEEDTDDREKEREKRKDHYRDADDEDIMLQKELAEEVRSSMLGRKKKTTKKDTDDDIEFIDL